MDEKKELWQNYFANPCPENREKIILAYAPLIKYCAQRIYQGLPANVELDDLLAYGSIGLIDAINKFNPQKNNSFETYAVIRIRGAIIDGLRKMDWIPQSLRRKAKEIERAFITLEQKLGRSPSDTEVAQFLGIDEKELDKQLQDVGNLSIISLEQPIDNGEKDLLSLNDLLIDDNSPDPTEKIELEDLKKHLARELSMLTEKERLIITLYYYEELTTKEISKILELSEGRISQIHKKAVLKLKSKLYHCFIN
ncbi:MAG: FliA/WhiG family RNA polymerase sigma factor [Clostridia bacterium]|nr:FliA/WhiG family RNA polymerase sigma factor [Clostridia bacterium]